MVKKFPHSLPDGKKKTTAEIVYNFGRDFLENYYSI